MPIYNTEPYLEKCLESIQGQTFDNFEVICVDDCSPDHSASIVERFSSTDDRFRLVRHSENLGLGGARNTGIRHASGDFVMGVDSDDYIHPKMVEDLHECITSTGSDIAECGYAEVTEQGVTLNTYAPSHPVLSVTQDTNIFYATRYAFWNKIYRRSLFTDHDVWFPNHIYYEDLATIPRLIARSSRVAYLGSQRYLYVQRKSSITNTIRDKSILDYIRAFDIITEDLHALDLFEIQRANFEAAVRVNMDFIKRKIAASNDLKNFNLIRYADFLERALIGSASRDTPAIGVRQASAERQAHGWPDRDPPVVHAREAISVRTPADAIRSIAIISQYDGREAVMRMKFGALRSYLEDRVSFSNFSNHSTVADAILVNHLDPLEHRAGELRNFRQKNPLAPVVALISDFYPRVATQVEQFRDVVDTFVVPTEEIKTCLQSSTDRCVIAIPDPIDFLLEKSLPKKHVEKKPLDVVWFGYPESFTKSMEHYSKRLEQYHARRRIRYHIITDVRGFDPINNALIHQYNHDSFHHLLPMFDLCVLSHIPNDFQVATFFKSENKAVLAINRGVPVIATRTPAYQRLLESCGLEQWLFSSVPEMEHCIDRIEDPAARNSYLRMS
ncbi:glycosyltransferase [Methylobacterium sp. J-076]|nr:glycosyltransferase [Methylobacterium sp. J-076]